MTPKEVLAEARWQLSPERGDDWRRQPAPLSPQGNLDVGDFGDAGDLVNQLAEALESTLARLSQQPPSREVKAMNEIIAAMEATLAMAEPNGIRFANRVELKDAITICKRWLAT